MPKSLAKVAVRRAAPRDREALAGVVDTGHRLFYKRPLSEPLTRHTWARIMDDASPIHAIVAKIERTASSASPTTFDDTRWGDPGSRSGDLFVIPRVRVGEQLIGGCWPK